MTENGVKTSDGQLTEADVVIWCTGFAATEYLSPIAITGEDGRDLHEVWKDGPEAYLGISTPGFPNLFMSYGPNTGSLTNTITSMLEYQAGYIRQAIEHIARTGYAYAVKQSVHDDFNDELSRRLQGTVFSTGCPGWYSTANGKVTTVWAGPHTEYRRRTKTFDPSVYEQTRPSRLAPNRTSPNSTSTSRQSRSENLTTDDGSHRPRDADPRGTARRSDRLHRAG